MPPVTLQAPHPLVLASASPRRRELVRALGTPFEVDPADVDETPDATLAPADDALRLARAKADVVAARHPDRLVLAADTIVVHDGVVLGKPRDAAQNRAFLARLAGVPHAVVTAHVLVHAAGEGAGGAREVGREAVRTEVRLRALDAATIDRWVASGEGLDKAGGYAIQDTGAALVDVVHGCYSNVVGLSLPAVTRLLDAARSAPPAAPPAEVQGGV
jgi:septum formation protein